MIGGHCSRRLTGGRGDSFGVGQERSKAEASRQWRGCESLPESQHCRQRREEYCSRKMASGLNREDPPSPILKKACRLWGYHRSVGEKLEVSLQCQLSWVGLSCPSWEGDQREASLHPHQDAPAALWGEAGLSPQPGAAVWIPCEHLLRAAAGTTGLQRLRGSSHSLLFA